MPDGTPRAALNRPQARPAVFKLDADGDDGDRVAWAMAEQSPALDAIQVMAIQGNKLALRALQDLAWQATAVPAQLGDMAKQSDKVSVDALHVRAEQGDKLAVDALKTMAERERTRMDEPRAFARHQAFRLTSRAMAQPDDADAVAMLGVMAKDNCQTAVTALQAMARQGNSLATYYTRYLSERSRSEPEQAPLRGGCA